MDTMRRAPYDLVGRHTREMLRGLDLIAARVKSGFYTGMAGTLIDRHKQLHDVAMGSARADQRMLAGAGAQRIANMLLHPDDYELPGLDDSGTSGGHG